MGLAKRVMDAAAKPALAATLEQEVTAQQLLAASDDFAEGTQRLPREARPGVRRALGQWRAAGQPPETKYARSGDVHIAYQVFGEGERDLVVIPGFVSHLELFWESEAWASAFRRLASMGRVVIFDRRGTGMSDPVAEAPPLEQRMDDVRAVMDAAGVERATLIGLSEGVPMSILFAATHPERCEALVLYGGMARVDRSRGLPVRVAGAGPGRVGPGAAAARTGARER